MGYSSPGDQAGKPHLRGLPAFFFPTGEPIMLHPYPNLKANSFLPHSEPANLLVGCSSYAHILIPVRLTGEDQTALFMGLQMAHAFHGKLTVLHVLAPQELPNSMHWLDAIDDLHRTLSRERVRLDLTSIQRGREKVLTFLDRELPAGMSRADIRAECRIGDVAQEIARFAEQSADLVLMSEQRSGWRFSLRPSMARRVLQRTHKPVLLVHPQPKAQADPRQLHAKVPPGSTPSDWRRSSKSNRVNA